MDSYFTPTIPHGCTTVTIRIEFCDKDFIVPKEALGEKSEYFRLLFDRSWLALPPPEMPLIPGVITPTILSMFLRWVFTDKIEYDGDPKGEKIPMTERLTILISLARFAEIIDCPTMADPIVLNVRFILMGIATPFSASQADSDNSMEIEETDDDNSMEIEETDDDNSMEIEETDDDNSMEIEETDDDNSMETEEADDDNESSNDSSQSEVVDPDPRDHLDTGFAFEGDSNTRYLVSAHIIQALNLRAGNRVRRTIIDSCLREYFSHRGFRFIGLVRYCPEFAVEFVQRLPAILAETMTYRDGNVFFWDPVSGVPLPMYQADTTGSRWTRAQHPHEPSYDWRWASV